MKAMAREYLLLAGGSAACVAVAYVVVSGIFMVVGQ